MESTQFVRGLQLLTFSPLILNINVTLCEIAEEELFPQNIYLKFRKITFLTLSEKYSLRDLVAIKVSKVGWRMYLSKVGMSVPTSTYNFTTQKKNVDVESQFLGT